MIIILPLINLFQHSQRYLGILGPIQALIQANRGAKKKGLRQKSGTWTAKPRDIVSMMQLEDTLVKPDSDSKSNPATPNRSRRKDRKRRERGDKSKAGIWSRGKKWAKRYVLDKPYR